jgi:hypothetical protein
VLFFVGSDKFNAVKKGDHDAQNGLRDEVAFEKFTF